MSKITPDGLLKRYRERLRIDRDDLDTVLVEHPSHVEAVGRNYARAVETRDIAREDQKRISAELKPAIRSSLDKPTISGVDEVLESLPDHREARLRYKAAERKVNEWEAMRDAWKARGFVLKDLVQLHLANHYSTDSVTEEALEARRKHARGDRRPKTTLRKRRPQR